MLRHGMGPETARRINPAGRCACDLRVCFQVQCVHEFCADGGFIAEKWDTRHNQSSALTVDLNTAAAAAAASSDDEDVSVDNGEDVSVDNGASASATRLAEVATRTSNALSPRELLLSSSNRESHEDMSDADDTDDWDFNTGVDDGEDVNELQFAEIDRAKFRKLCQDLADAVCDSEKSRQATLVGGGLLS